MKTTHLKVIMKKQNHLLRLAPALGLLLFAAGCSMPNASNPTLSLDRATVTGDQADLDVVLSNPSDMDVAVETVDWELTYGPLPVAEGSWQGPFALASGESMTLNKTVPFTMAPLDPSAESIELTGSLLLVDPGNSMGLNEGSFATEASVNP